MITPTVGRVVWLWPCALTRIALGCSDDTQPLAATVAFVHNDRLVNLSAVDHNGKAFSMNSVQLLQGDEDMAHVTGTHCAWMPYQKAQAAKATGPWTGVDLAKGPDTTSIVTVTTLGEHIARVCHEVNRGYCEALGDTSQPAWEDAPEWQRESARLGVELHSKGDHGPEASHISWMNQKLADGWKYGPVKDADKKEHHCLVPFADLPVAQQAKDFIFRAVVHALRIAHHPV